MRGGFGRFFVTALVCIVSLAGCQSTNAADPPTADMLTRAINKLDPETLIDGGDLRLPLAQFPTNFNPLTIDSVSAYPMYATAAYPRAFTVNTDGSHVLNTDYFTAAEQTGVDPQVITYTINPAAVWTDGTPITWQDMKSQAHALSGKDDRYHVFSTVGYDRVESVTAGVNDRQAVVRFARPYAEWLTLFSGTDVLLPRAMTETPEAFADAQHDRPGPSAGPFVVSGIDAENRRIVFSRNERWWGRPPRLNTISLVTIEPTGWLDALHDGTIDATEVDTAIQVAAAARIPDIEVRQAPTPAVWSVFFNGSQDSWLADPALRHAIARGIDRDRIIEVTQRGLTDSPVESNSHIFANGQPGYRDNADGYDYDPYRARQELDSLGWKMSPSGVREKDGHQLTLTNLYVESPSGDLLGQLLAEMLDGIGVDLIANDFTAEEAAIELPHYDLLTFAINTAGSPLAMVPVYYRGGGYYNMLTTSTPDLDAKIDQLLGETGDTALNTANEIDEMLWQEAHSVPLLRIPGNTAVRRDLANFGAFGAADVDFTAIGYCGC